MRVSGRVYVRSHASPEKTSKYQFNDFKLCSYFALACLNHLHHILSYNELKYLLFRILQQTMGCNITLQYLGYCTPLSNRESFSSLLFSYSMLKIPTISKLVYNWKQYLPYSQLLSVTYMEFLTYSAACIFTFFLNLIFFLWPLFIFCELSIQIISIFIQDCSGIKYT